MMIMKTFKSWTCDYDTHSNTWILHDPTKQKLVKSDIGHKYSSSEVARISDPDVATHILACVNSCFGLDTQELMEFDKDWRSRLKTIQKTL